MLTQERLKEIYTYCPETGIFTKRQFIDNRGRTWGGFAITKASSSGYIRIGIDYKRYQAHNLAWLYMTGNFPEYEIDHINEIKADNRFCNLRDVPRAINIYNQEKARKYNKIGLRGVCKENRSSKYRAEFKSNGTNKYLGCFDTPEQAHQAYINAKNEIMKHH